MCRPGRRRNRRPSEERRIRFLRAGIVGGEGGEEGRSELLLEMVERPAPGIGHGNQLVRFRKLGQCRRAVGKRLPGAAESRRRSPNGLLGQAELRRDDHVDPYRDRRETGRHRRHSGPPVQAQRGFTVDGNAASAAIPPRLVEMPPSKSISVPTTSKVIYLNSLSPWRDRALLCAAEFAWSEQKKCPCVRGAGLSVNPETRASWPCLKCGLALPPRKIAEKAQGRGTTLRNSAPALFRNMRFRLLSCHGLADVGIVQCLVERPAVRSTIASMSPSVQQSGGHSREPRAERHG